MTEHDEVIDLLRAARPDELPEDLVSPHAPAAQALLEEILSMPTIASPNKIDEAPAAPGIAPRRRRRRRLALVGTAAAGIAAAVATATIVLNPVEPTGAATIDAALTRSAESLRGSGRAEVTWEIVYDDGVDTGLDMWEYSGDDYSVTLRYVPVGQAELDPSAPAPINRYVDGELYLYFVDSTGTYRWYHDVNGDPSTSSSLQVEPDSLLAQLEPAGAFEEVGEETVDGVRTRRLRATNPGDTPPLRLGTVTEPAEVTALEVWVDDDGMVRRLDIAFAEGDFFDEATVSVRFYDFGEPITIEAPTDAEDIDPVG